MNKENIYECRVSKIEYTDDQKNALDKIVKFKNQNKDLFFLLAGYAGTGN